MSFLSITGNLISSYNSLVSALPENLRILPPLFFIAIIITLYGVFVWFFYRFLSKRDVIKLDLKEYNDREHPGLIKFFAVLFYIIRFMIVSPIAIFFWFTVLSVFLIILAKEIEVGTVILICASLISAIRVTAYFNEDLSRDLAKLFPFTLLAVAVVTPNFINLDTSIGRIAQVPLFLNTALYYFLFIVALETLLRLAFLPFEVARSKKERVNSARDL